MGNEMINHPPHYGGDTQYETIKVIEAWGLGFHLGNAVKYIARAGKKTGNNIVLDLAKAVWYLNRAIGVNTEQEAGQDASDALAMATVAAAVASAGTGPAQRRDDLAAVLLEKAKARAAAGAAAGTGPEKASKPKGTNWRRTWPKTCVICGKKFDAKSCSAKCCSPACVKEKNVRYQNAKYQAKKPTAVKPTVKKPEATVGKEKACAACGKKFTAWRKDQKCCSTTCGKSPKALAARAAAGAVVVTDDAAADAAAASAEALYPATCEVCGLGFNPKYPTQKTCSITCAKDLREASPHA
jgi:hypothetical protein